MADQREVCAVLVSSQVTSDPAAATASPVDVTAMMKGGCLCEPDRDQSTERETEILTLDIFDFVD